MKKTGITVLAIAALSLAGAVYAQEAMKGEIAAVSEATGKISIKQNPGTVGSGSTAAATEFKVQDGLLFNAVKPGDKVTFTAESVDGVMTIKKLTKD
jgi:Cu(I)/Ag(I) efflux system protein CusF